MSDWEDDIYDDEEEDDLSFEEEEEDTQNDDKQTESGEGNAGSEMSEDDNAEGCIDIEGQYFLGKEYKEDEDYPLALQTLDKIIALRNKPELSGNEYIFKAVKQAIKICQETGNYDKILEYLDLFLSQLKHVSQAYGDTSISKLLYRFNRSSNPPSTFLKSMYQKFLDYLGTMKEDTTNEKKLYVRVSLYMANVLILEGEYDDASRILLNLEKIVLGSPEGIRSSFLLDILASEMVISSEYRLNLKELTRLSILANSSVSGIPQSRIVGTVKQCSGLVYMYDEDFKSANKCFQDSFKGFNECGDDRRIQVLLKFIISNLLCESEINPFKSSDFQGFLKLESIELVMSIYNAVHQVDIDRYNEIIHEARFEKLLSGDYFLRDFIPYVTELVQIGYILKYLNIFTRLSISRLCLKLRMDELQLESLLIRLFNTGRISNIKLDLVDRVIKKVNSDDDGQILDKDLDALGVLSNILKAQPSNLDISQLGEEAEEMRQKVQSYEGEFPPHQSPFEVGLSRSEENMDLNPGYRAGRLLCTDNIGNRGGPSSDGMDGNNSSGNNSCNPSIGTKFLLAGASSGPDKPAANLSQLQHDICIPFSSLSQESLLSSLFVTSLQCEHSKYFQSKTELLSILDDYLNFIKAGIPTKQLERISHLEKIRRDKLESEFKTLHKDDDQQKALENLSTNIDRNVPDVLKTTTMSSLEPSPGEDEVQSEIQRELLYLTRDQIRDRKLESIVGLSRHFEEYRINSMFTFKKGLNVNIFERNLEGVKMMAAAARTVKTTDPQFRSSAISARTSERLDTESLESGSLGGYDDEVDDDNDNGARSRWE
ncbi:DEKNAAC101659 [Brettanomyces naardenensis]|uniref:DEKNAAC101659 n=1 Tax=Brettanomyces naardenensis TaxID=13370 RepID=A0A448YIN7_BRENA|nr:DEKNAAC101659 [Brettanomyces naardenensis]